MSSIDASLNGCWEVPGKPSPELLAALRTGPLAGRSGADLDALLTGLRRDRVTRPVIFVGAGTCGLGAGAARTLAKVRELCATMELDADIREVGCIGLCSEEPLMDVQLPGRTRVCFGSVTEDKVEPLLKGLFRDGQVKDQVLGQFLAEGQAPWPGVKSMAEHPFLAIQKRWVLANSGLIDFTSIDEYIARGGYSAVQRALTTLTRQEVVDEILASGLRGRGGGGFPTGRKWQMALAAAGAQKYMVCNADEGDPGAFMDRAVCESDPHRVLEGMITGCYAIGASRAYIYIRAEYPLAIQNLKRAMAQAKDYGLLGENILGSGFSLDIVIKMGAGAFVCGEETALMQSIEGKRGMPRPRPPYPIQSGLFGMPTVINNVETFANVPGILQKGSARFAAVGTQGSKGTKVFALSGMVRRTGLVEVPMGTPIRDVVFAVGGGIPNGKKCKAVQIGGPSGGCIPEPAMDLVCDYEALKSFGAIMGSGGLVVLDENTCMVDLAKFFMEFIQSESCGKCIPCREGTRQMLQILQTITHNRRGEEGIDALLRVRGVMVLKELGEAIKASSLCGLGQTAPNPVLSTLKWFRDEYEAHIYERRCPSGTCRELVGAPCQSGCPVGTEVWKYVAHVAQGEYDEAYQAIRSANPFPSVCARVCNHPCEASCRCGTTGGDPISIRNLKRFVVDRVDPASFKPAVRPAKPDAARVAVVGGGPAGLCAANALSRQGYRITLLEREQRLGGMLVAGIPAYRLPRQVLDQEIQNLLNPNITVEFGKTLGRDFTLGDLKGYQAVYVAIGAHHSKRLGLPDDGVKGVLPGIEFLKGFNLLHQELAHGRVGVVGGGNSALDAARVALRQEAVSEVTIFYRRTRGEMPAYAEEVEAALEEGIRLEALVAPVAVQSEQGRLTGVRFQRNELGDKDETGRARPVPIPGSEFVAELDTLIVAISEEPEAELLDGLKRKSWGGLVINPESCLASEPGVFGGGDVVSGPGTVIEAVAAGKNAAVMIDRYLQGKQLKRLPTVALPTDYLPPFSTGEEEGETAGRAIPPHLPVAARAKNFREVDLCFPEDHALCEARRCLRCDLEFTQPL
ncbi:MAG: NADH-ubiquinone oxidoreductase-F iron-sulfur binding region domain-containing protein [Holophaga sp.]|nr:NADH-ubiquinone oxidoreductase-F iron-sulfur binding region domain-containing protein [Holophaga sp.]